MVNLVMLPLGVCLLFPSHSRFLRPKRNESKSAFIDSPPPPSPRKYSFSFRCSCEAVSNHWRNGRRYECPASVRQEVQQQPQRTFRRPPAALIADDGGVEKCEVQTKSEIKGKARLPLLNLTSQSFPLVNLLSLVVFAHSVILSPTVKVVLN